MTDAITEPERPLHPLPEMTTGELARYRRELASSLRGLPPEAPVRVLLLKKLAQADAEQDDRRKIAEANGG